MKTGDLVPFMTQIISALTASWRRSAPSGSRAAQAHRQMAGHLDELSSAVEQFREVKKRAQERDTMLEVLLDEMRNHGRNGRAK